VRILVKAPNWIGDQILAYPFFHYLRKAAPRATIVSICSPWVEDVQFRDLVDEVHVLPRIYRGGLMEKWRAIEAGARAMRAQGKWDLAFSLPNSFSSGWLLLRSGARRRRGYDADGRGILLNERLKWDADPNRHRAQAFVDLLPPEWRPTLPVRDFWGIPPDNLLDSSIPGELIRFDPEKSWPGFETVEPPAEKYWVLAPGATADSRRWPLENFAQLARKIAETTGMRGLIVGGPKEAPIAAELCGDRALKLRDFTGQGPVPVLHKIFANSQFTLSNESGLAHVASLCGSPVQIVCGAADPKRTQPLGPGRVQVAINPVDCWPCEKNVCSQPFDSKLQCLRGIRPEMILEEVLRVAAAPRL